MSKFSNIMDSLRKTVGPGYAGPVIMNPSTGTKKVIAGVSAKYNPNAFNQTIAVTALSMAMGAGTALGAGAIHSLIKKFQLHKREVLSPMKLSAMLLKNKDLAAAYSASADNKTVIEDLFKVIEHFAPNMSENPIAAGTFVRQFMKYSEPGQAMVVPEALNTLGNINRAISDPVGDNLKATALNNMTMKGYAAGDTLAKLLHSEQYFPG